MKPREGTLQAKVFEVLKDRKWHCRSHDYSHITIEQLAGGGGIQGLERGTKTRSGLSIESKNESCQLCKKSTRWDRWTGKKQSTNAPAHIPMVLQNKILAHFNHKDEIEGRERPRHELVIDHRFPMLRWNKAEEALSANMSGPEIEDRFQLLKSDGGGNHNLLKSRACEKCLQSGKRGTPMGVNFFYASGADWPKLLPRKGDRAEAGCVGCGWYDFSKWRKALNKHLQSR